MPRTLLIVDDDPFVSETLEEALREDFDTVVHAWDGVEGLEAAQRQKPTLVLLDMEMPRMKGLEACQQMRALPDFQDVPIVMLTANNEEADARSAFDAGANDYLIKPFSVTQLRARLRTWLLREGTTTPAVVEP